MTRADEHIALFREYMALDRKRTSKEGVTPLEYQRWLDLKGRLSQRFSKGPPARTPDRRASVRVPTRMSVEFETPEQFRKATIRNISKGGLFIATSFVADIGTHLVLRITVESTGDLLEVPCVVVSNGVADGFSTQILGMGVRFDHLSPDVERRINELREKALETTSEKS